MLVAFLFCNKDKELAFKNLAWSAEIGVGNGHEILVVCPSGVSADDAAKALALAEEGFDKATLYHLTDDCTAEWPFGPNFMFRRTVDYISHFRLWPFLLQESDAWLLKEDSLDRIEAEYRKSGKQFMGYLESQGKEGQHMNGVGVYGDITTYAPALLSAPWPQEQSQVGLNHMAFDMAGGMQVCELLHHSRLFQFQYKKEVELLRDETLSFLNPDAAIFHTEKTGRLVELLRQRNSGGAAVPAAHKLSVFHPGINLPPTSLQTEIFIKTYSEDNMWHAKCLASIERYCSGFEGVVENREQIDGNNYLFQQVVKLEADRHSRADFILVTDSDTLFTAPVTPETFLRNGKPMWFYATREAVLQADANTLKWFECMERFVGAPAPHEFMRRQPFFVPRWLLQAFRQFCWTRHGQSVRDYVLGQEHFSEWNCLGFYAWTYHREAFAWMDVNAVDCPPITCKQFWSPSHWPQEKREAQFREHLPEINAILGTQEPVPVPVAPHPATLISSGNEEWNQVKGDPKSVMDIASQAAAEDAKKQAQRDRMAAARAQIGKKKKKLARK